MTKKRPSDQLSKKEKKAKLAGGEIKFATYISKAHRDMHGTDRMISGSALITLDQMVDHLLTNFVSQGKKVMRYSKADTFSETSAKATATMALTGPLLRDALKAADTATANYKAQVQGTAPPAELAAA